MPEIDCCECEVEIDLEDALAREANGRAPWVCPDCARTCEVCERLIPWDDAQARHGDDEGPWLCPEHGFCARCGSLLEPGDAVPRDADGIAPWVHRSCAYWCEECDGQIAADEAVSLRGNNTAPWLHRDCARWCDVCNDFVPRDQGIARDNDGVAPWLCRECVICPACEAPLGGGDIAARDADGVAPWLHADCARWCDTCGDLVAWDEAVAQIGNDAAPWLCQGCAENEDAEYEADEADNYEYPHPWSYRPDPEFFGTNPTGVPGTPYLGLELEIEAHSYADREGIIDATEGSDDLFYCKADGSLGKHGVEVVSHPMTLGYIQAFDWADLCATLATRGSSWDVGTCGIHVHLSRDSMTRSHLWRFARLLNGNPSEFGELAGRFNSTYARFADDDFDPVSKAIAGKAPNPSRYSALNLENETTVEVRIFRGTLKPLGVLANLELVHAMWAYTASLSVPAVKDGALDFSTFRAWVEGEARDTYPALVGRLVDRFGSSTNPVAVAA